MQVLRNENPEPSVKIATGQSIVRALHKYHLGCSEIDNVVPALISRILLLRNAIMCLTPPRLDSLYLDKL